MKIAVKEVNKPLKILETTKIYRSDAAREHIGQDSAIQYVQISPKDTLCMCVDEDGLPKELSVNFLFPTSSPHFPIQKAVGTVVFTRHKWVNVFEEEIWDYEVTDLTDDDIEHIKIMLDEAYQIDLNKKFKDYGKGCIVVEPIDKEDLFKALFGDI